MGKPIEVNLEVGTDGSFSLDVLNGDGKNCLSATKKLEGLLGGVKGKRVMKPEAQRTQPIAERRTVQN